MQQSNLALSLKIVLPMFALAFPFSNAFADAQAGEKKAQLCLVCHLGKAEQQFYPVLAGQPQAYFIAQIQAYKIKRRTELSMTINVANLKEDDVSDLADYFSAQKIGAYSWLDTSRVEAGRQALAVLTCQSCHAAGYKGEGTAARLASQSPKYTALQLRAFKIGARFHPTGTSETEIKSLSEETIDAISNALASLD